MDAILWIGYVTPCGSERNVSVSYYVIEGLLLVCRDR